MNRQIDCRTCESYMDDFLDRNIIGEELYDFLNHILSCDECYEELETRYLVSEVLLRLESGETIDLRAELKNKVKGARRALRMHSYTVHIFESLEVVAAVVFIFTILNGILRYL